MSRFKVEGMLNQKSDRMAREFGKLVFRVRTRLIYEFKPLDSNFGKSNLKPPQIPLIKQIENPKQTFIFRDFIQ